MFQSNHKLLDFQRFNLSSFTQMILFLHIISVKLKCCKLNVTDTVLKSASFSFCATVCKTAGETFTKKNTGTTNHILRYYLRSNVSTREPGPYKVSDNPFSLNWRNERSNTIVLVKWRWQACE